MWMCVVFAAAGFAVGQPAGSSTLAPPAEAAPPAAHEPRTAGKFEEALAEGLGAAAALQLAVEVDDWQRARRQLVIVRGLITGGHEEHWRGLRVGAPPQASGLADALGARGHERARAALLATDLKALDRAIASHDAPGARPAAADLVRAFTFAMQATVAGPVGGSVALAGATVARRHVAQAYEGAVALVAMIGRGDAVGADVRLREIGWHLDQAEAASPTPAARAALAPIRNHLRAMSGSPPAASVLYAHALDLVGACSDALRQAPTQ